MMLYVLSFDEKNALTQYLDWLNQRECNCPLDQSSPWVNDKDFEVLVSLEESQENKLSDYFFCGTLSIVSKNFRKVLDECSLDLEFVPVSIMCGETEFDYYALHVLKHLDALSVKNSHFAGMKYGMVAGITKLVLNDEIIENEKVFMLKNTFTPIVIVDNEIKARSEALGLKGMTFIPLNAYQEDTRGI